MSHNLFMNWLGDAVIFMAHNDVPRVAGNVLLAVEPPSEWDNDLNYVGELIDAEGFFVAPLAGVDELDINPREGRLQMPDTLGIESRWPRNGPLRFTFRHQAASE